MATVASIRENLLKIWKNKEIRDRIWFSLVILVAFRFLASVPIPGVPLDSLKEFFGDSGFGEVMSLVSGGVLENATIVAIGLTPYINASIIFQLLGSIVPKIEELQKEGEQGRRTINRYTRLLTVPLAILQSLVIYTVLQQYGIMSDLAPLDLVNVVATLTAGSMIMMWMAELVSESGLGGGSSYIIFLGILAGIPGSLLVNINTMGSTEMILLIVMVIAIIMSVVFVTQAERWVPIQFARRVRSVGPTVESHIPIKLNQSGVMPVIFAMSLLTFPQLIAPLLTSGAIPEAIQGAATWVLEVLNDPLIYNTLLFTLIIFFSYFYTFVVFNPGHVAENLQKQGAFIPGVRPGKHTVKFLTTSASRLAIGGALFLAIIAVVPSIAVEMGLMSKAVFTGTGLLIVVGVVLDIRRQIGSMIVSRSYESYL